MSGSLRDDALQVVAHGIAAADPERLTRAALRARLDERALAPATHVVAVGKAAHAMWRAARPLASPQVDALLVVPDTMAATAAGTGARVVGAGHPLPTGSSVLAAAAALDLARAARDGGWMWLLVSGGASALLASPAPGISLSDKVAVTRALLRCGADIVSINVVRRHLSAIKGGRLARAAGGRCATLALSDVVGDHEDDLSVIGSGPGVADASTVGDALAVLDRFGLRATVPPHVVALLERGRHDRSLETPKPGEADLGPVRAWVVGGRREAMAGARRTAESIGYATVVVEAPVLGEARDAARQFVHFAVPACKGRPRCCVIATGETTVTVKGDGRGGRNQEFALAAAAAVAGVGRPVVVCSVGTDGIDGPTDAAGGIVDDGTCRRAAELGVSIDAALEDNDAYRCLAQLGGLVKTGPTGTNVGDLMVFIAA